MPMSKFSRRAFTLVELLVVIAIIGILIALLLPAVQAAREAARRSQCTNNLKQYGIAIHNYIDTFKVVPMAGNGDWNHWDNGPAAGWQARILPFAEQEALYQQFEFNNLSNVPGFGVQDGRIFFQVIQDQTAPNSLGRARRVQVPFMKCPSDTQVPVFWADWTNSTDGVFTCSYAGSLGSQRTPSADPACQPWLPFALKTADHGNTYDPNDVSGMFGRGLWQAPMKLSYVTDGTSNTIMVGEMLALCNDHSSSSPELYFNGSGNAHASTVVPMNDMSTCHHAIDASPDPQSAAARDPLASAPQCWNWSNWNYSWGFRSKHPAGCNFLMVDGSARFLGQNINHVMYQRLGGKADGFSLGDFELGAGTN